MAAADEREAELIRMLFHARGCDGIKCAFCRKIDLRLQDGGAHVAEDPTLRFSAVDEHLSRIYIQVERIYGVLEGAPVPASVRSAVHQLSEYVVVTRNLMRLPVVKTLRPSETKRPKPRPTPVRFLHTDEDNDALGHGDTSDGSAEDEWLE